MGRHKVEPGDGYKRHVLEIMRINGWTRGKTAKHFHHAYNTIVKWQRELGETESDDEPMGITLGDGNPDWASQHKGVISYHIEVIKLQAELDMVKTMYQELLSKVVDRSNHETR